MTQDIRSSQKGGGAYGRSGLFVSYRRGDSAAWAGRLMAELRSYYGPNRVYFDLDSTLPAQDYVEKIERWLHHTAVTLLVIGPRWLDERDSSGSRRLDDPADLHRREVEIALQSGAVFMPILVGQAQMPSSAALPDSLTPICKLQALRMQDEDWEYCFGRLLNALEGRGVRPAKEPAETPPTEFSPVSTKRYSRTVKASRRRTLDAAISAVSQVGYPEVKVSVERSEVNFNAIARQVTVNVVDAGGGKSTIIVALPTVRGGVAGSAAVAGAIVFAPLLAAYPALRLWERQFAKKFLDNVETVLDGRPVGRGPLDDTSEI